MSPPPAQCPAQYHRTADAQTLAGRQLHPPPHSAGVAQGQGSKPGLGGDQRPPWGGRETFRKKEGHINVEIFALAHRCTKGSHRCHGNRGGLSSLDRTEELGRTETSQKILVNKNSQSLQGSSEWSPFTPEPAA